MINNYHNNLVHMCKSLAKVLPEIITMHKEVYKRMHSSSLFLLQRKKSKYTTHYSCDGISLTKDDDSVILHIYTSNTSRDDPFIEPEFNEFVFKQGSDSTDFVVGDDGVYDLIANYNHCTKELVLEDDISRVYKLEDIDDCKEMFFTLSLEYATLKNPEEFWELIQCVQMLEAIPELKGCTIAYEDNLLNEFKFDKAFAKINEMF